MADYRPEGSLCLIKNIFMARIPKWMILFNPISHILQLQMVLGVCLFTTKAPHGIQKMQQGLNFHLHFD